MSFLDTIVDNVYCINLDRRDDRWKECLVEFEKINIKDKVSRFSAIEMKPGIAGCTRSHYELIKLARSRKERNILILEDDVIFKHEIFHEVLNNTFNQIKSKNLTYDLIYLGGNLKGTENFLIDDNLAKINCIKTTHAYIVNFRAYDLIINSYENINWNNWEIWYHENPNRMNIDVQYTRLQKLGNSYGTYPSLADQKTGYSDIQNEVYNYNLSTFYNITLERNSNSIKPTIS